MKKFAALLCGAALALSTATCSATIATDKIAIGGIRPGMTQEDVISIAGQPDEKTVDHENWYYYNGFVIEFDDDTGLIDEIKTRYNTVATPDGVYVGYSEDVLTKIYGTADKVKRNQNSIDYTYYSADYTRKLKFKTVNGVIKKISCELDDNAHHN